MIRTLSVGIGAVLLFILAALFIPADRMTETISAGVTIAAGVGLWRWGPAAYRAFLRGARTPEEQGVIGMVLLLAGIIAQRIYSVTYIRMGRPDSWQSLYVSPFIAYVVLGALALFISATKYQGERPTRFGSVAAAVLAFIAVALSSLGPFIVAKLGGVISLVARLIH